MFISIHTKFHYLVISISWLRENWLLGVLEEWSFCIKSCSIKVLQKLTTKDLCNICKFIMTLVEPELALKLGDN